MVNLTEAHVAWLVPIQSALLPLLVALITTRVANPRVKALALQFLVAVGTTITVVIQSPSFDWTDLLVNFGIGYITSQVFYKQVWERYGLADFIGRLFPERGITTFPLTASYAPPVIPAADIPPITIRLDTGEVGTTNLANEGVTIAPPEVQGVPVVTMSTATWPSPPLFDQARERGIEVRPTPVLDAEVGPLEDLSEVDPLSLPMEQQVRLILVWAEEQEAAGKSPEWIAGVVASLEAQNFQAANDAMRAAGTSEDEIEAFWKGMNEFGDSEPADAIDESDGNS